MASRKGAETAVVGGEQYVVGQRVCIAGRGTDAVVHRHGAVDRFTATTMVVKSGDAQYRYRVGDGSSLEIGHGNGYGGTYVAPRCQRPRKG
jgi:hypothetical protein